MKKFFPHLLFFTISCWLFSSGTLHAQLKDLSGLEDFYHSNSSRDTSCGGLKFANTSGDILQIVLIRHGKPMLNKKGWFSSKEAKEYSRRYDLVGVYDFESNPFCFSPDEIDTLYSSNLTRAQSTASKILENSEIEIVQSRLFREFEREVFLLPVLRMPLNFWLVSSRLLWYANLHSSQTESYKAARRRADSAADFLELKATKDGRTALVAHGMFNKRLSNALQKKGWTQVYTNGNGYLSVRILAKKK